MFRAFSYSQLRAELKAVLDEVCDTHEPAYVTRRNGGNVMLAREGYEAMDETAYLIRSPTNARRLRAALNEKREERMVMDIDELPRLVEA